MNVGIRRVGLVIMVLFIGLVAQLTYLQMVDSKKLADDPHNARKFLADLRQPRGEIVTSDGFVVAKSVPSNDEFRYQREYPAATAKLFAQVVGYQSIQFGSVGVESTYSSQLAGKDLGLVARNLRQLVSGQPITGTVVLTLSLKAQLAAAAALDGRRGSVVVLDMHTGGVVAMLEHHLRSVTPRDAQHEEHQRSRATSFSRRPTSRSCRARGDRSIRPAPPSRRSPRPPRSPTTST